MVSQWVVPLEYQKKKNNTTIAHSPKPLRTTTAVVLSDDTTHINSGGTSYLVDREFRK